MNQTSRFIRGKFFLVCVVCSPIFFTAVGGVFYSRLREIAESKNYSTDDKRDIFNTFDKDDKNDQGFPVDPFDLMNRLKQAGEMNDATTPSDALDEALNAFEESEYLNVPIK